MIEWYSLHNPIMQAALFVAFINLLLLINIIIKDRKQNEKGTTMHKPEETTNK